jgi:16S rRNA (guanine966-N2)-methyltransferase
MRITGGVFRSRQLIAPKGQATRPTADRVREALFSMLGSRVSLQGAYVLDLYAGTGALSFECLSRGAAKALLVEKDRRALDAIAANARALDVEAAIDVVGIPVERGPGIRSVGPFTLVFADPPYAEVESGKAVTAIGAWLSGTNGVSLLGTDGLLVLEHGTKTKSPIVRTLEIEDVRTYGDTSLTFYRRGQQPV